MAAQVILKVCCIKTLLSAADHRSACHPIQVATVAAEDLVVADMDHFELMFRAVTLWQPYKVNIGVKGII